MKKEIWFREHRAPIITGHLKETMTVVEKKGIAESDLISMLTLP